MTVHNTTQHSTDNLPSYFQTNIIAQMLSTGGEWRQTWPKLYTTPLHGCQIRRL